MDFSCSTNVNHVEAQRYLVELMCTASKAKHDESEDGFMIEQMSTREVYRNRWLSMREDAIRWRNNAEENYREGIHSVLEQSSGAHIIAAKGTQLCLVRQFRYPVNQWSWEFPGGAVPEHPDTDPLELAKQELREETGLLAGAMRAIGSFSTAPGITTQFNTAFLATEISQGDSEPEPEEFGMESRWFEREEVERMIHEGEILAGPSITAYGLLLVDELRSR